MSRKIYVEIYEHCLQCKKHFYENIKSPTGKQFCKESHFKEITGLDNSGEHNFPSWCPLPDAEEKV